MPTSRQSTHASRTCRRRVLPTTSRRLVVCSLVALLAFASVAALAPSAAFAIGGPGPDTSAFGVDDSKRGNQIPLDLEFVNEDGKTVRLSDYIDGSKPVILNPGYFGCTKLCGEVMNALTETMRDVKGKIGVDYTVLTVSIDPTETWQLAKGKKASYIEWLHQPGAEKGWHFLTGNETAIRALTGAAGWNYQETVVNGQIEYMHGAAVVLLTPDGQVARFMRGANFQPSTLWLSLLEAGEGKISRSLFEHLTLFCYHYDPKSGTYSAQAFRIMQIGGALTVLLLAVVMGGFWLREMRRPAAPTTDPTSASSSSAPAAAATDGSVAAGVAVNTHDSSGNQATGTTERTEESPS